MAYDDYISGPTIENIDNDYDINNTSLILKRHYLETTSPYYNDVGECIFKYADYIHTYISLVTDGIPNGVTLNLVDENLNQLYSPVDTNGNWTVTQCNITVGEKNIIPLPAQFSNNFNNWTHFDTGVYNWNLKFSGNNLYKSNIIPIRIIIDDFEIWEVITNPIYPNSNIKVQLKTYKNTIIPSAYLNNNLLTAHASYDEDTGIITYPNIDLNNKIVGKHTQILNQLCALDYEISNPIEFYIDSNYTYNTQHKIGCQKAPNCTMGVQYSTLQLNMNGNNVTGTLYNDANVFALIVNNLPPNTYYCTTSVLLDDGNTYSCTGTIVINTTNCSLSLNMQNGNLIATYLYDDIPIPNATIRLINVTRNSTINVQNTNNDGQINWGALESNMQYKVAAINIDNQIILESQPLNYNNFVSDIKLNDVGNLIITTYENDNDSIVTNLSLEDNGNLYITTTISLSDEDTPIQKVNIDENGTLYYEY